MRYYIGVIHKDPDSDYGISFPGVACISAGTTFEEVMRMGREALSLQIEEMLAAGETVPDPAHISDIMANPVYGDGEPVLIAVPYEDISQAASKRAA